VTPPHKITASAHGMGAGGLAVDVMAVFSIQYLLIHGNGVTLRTQKVIQGGDNGHEASVAPSKRDTSPRSDVAFECFGVAD
jgi:hypothetical protein